MTIELDPTLGVWTPEYVEDRIKFMNSEEFEKLYGVTKEKAKSLISSNLKELPEIEDSPKDEYIELTEEEQKEVVEELEEEILEEVLDSAEDVPHETVEGKGVGYPIKDVIFTKFDPNNEKHQKDKKKMHWKTFEATYGVKPKEV